MLKFSSFGTLVIRFIMFLNSRSRVNFYGDYDWEKSRRRWDAARLSILNGAWRQHGLESLPAVLHIADKGTYPEQHSVSLLSQLLWNLEAGIMKCVRVYE